MTHFSSKDFENILLKKLHYLQNILDNFPKNFQYKILPHLHYLKTTQFNDFQYFKNKVTQLQNKIGQPKQLQIDIQQVQTFFKMFNIYIRDKDQKDFFIKKLQNTKEKVQRLLKDQQTKTKYWKKYHEQYYPDKIDKVDSLSKQFQMSSRLSKIYGNHNLSHHQRKAKDSKIQLVPRFITRLQQILHYQSNKQYMGNILCLTYQGNKIAGNKGYAVVNNNKIQWWEKKATQIPQVNLMLDNQQEKNQQNQKNNMEQEKQIVHTKDSRNYQKMKLSHIFLGHTQKITSISLSYDQMYLLSTGMDKTIKLWCLRMKTLIAQFNGHVETVWDVKWAPTGYYFISGGSDKMAILWRTDFPAPQRIFDHRGQIYKVDFLKNLDFVITAGQEGIIRIWKNQSAECIRQIKFPTSILNFELSFSGAYISLYQISGQISIYDISKGQKIKSFSLTEGEFTTTNQNKKVNKNLRPHDLAFSQDQKQFVVITSKQIFLYSMDKLIQKQPSNIYSSQRTQKKPPPKQVIYMGRDFNLTYCKYTRKHILIVAGTKKLIN